MYNIYIMTLSSHLINRLNNYAINYYMAHKNNNKEKINDVCFEIGIDTMGWDCIGNGSGRNVFDMDVFGYSNYILKLAHPHQEYDGIKQNKNEIKTWRSMSKKQKEYVVPIINSGVNSCWIVMPKGNSNPRIDYNWLNDAKYHLKDIVWEEDIQEENIVSINNKLKLCDYGMPSQ